MKGFIRSLLVSLWFMALTFPLVVIKIMPRTGEVFWRWQNCLYIGIGIFFLSFVWRAMLTRKGIMTPEEADVQWLFTFLSHRKNQNRTLFCLFAGLGCLTLIASLSFESGLSFISLLFIVICFFASYVSITDKRNKAKEQICAIASKITTPGKIRTSATLLVFLGLIALAFVIDTYQMSILSQTLIWVMLGLGLNIVVGQAGMLVLGYVAFYAVGAYSYAVGNAIFGSDIVGFWVFLPIGGLLAALAGILLSLPVLRLRGDYLAIVTLGFGEIVRVILQSGSLSLTPIADILTWATGKEMPLWMTTPLDLGGPAGISNIPAPQVFTTTASLDENMRTVYFVALGMTVLTIFAVARLRDSRLGRSWIALREDEIACEAMGINKVTAKLTAFALGACWAGFGGVLFAAKTGFINPASFTFMDSALILSVIVLGGLGSILGVIFGACVLILLPEYLRSFNEFRMLIFGACMVLMMVFRPQGLITPQAKKRFPTGSASPKTQRIMGGTHE